TLINGQLEAARVDAILVYDSRWFALARTRRNGTQIQPSPFHMEIVSTNLCGNQGHVGLRLNVAVGGVFKNCRSEQYAVGDIAAAAEKEIPSQRRHRYKSREVEKERPRG